LAIISSEIVFFLRYFCNNDHGLTPTNIGGDMKKPLKPARKNGLETADKNEEIIDLKDVVNQNQVSPDHNKEDILDLTNKISSKEQERSEAGVIELTDTIPPLSKPAEDQDDLQDRSSDNVIRLAEMTAVPPIDIEELSHEDIVELDDEDIYDLENENPDQFTGQLESTTTDSFDDDDDVTELSPDINLDAFDSSDHEDEKDDIDDFDLLSEVESDAIGKINALDVKELDDETTFKDIGSVLTEELDDPDDEFSETALALNQAMQADRDSTYEEDDDDELLEEIESVRDTLDNVFFEEDSQDPLFALDPVSTDDQKDEPEDDIDDFTTEELIPHSFDENASDALPNLFDNTSLEAEDILKDSDRHSNKAAQKNLFDVDVNLSNAKTSEDQPSQDQIEPFEAELTISSDEIESAVRHLIETKYGKKIEQMIIETIEKTIVREISKIKKAFLDKSGSIDASQ
jgi:hypothetical protein